MLQSAGSQRVGHGLAAARHDPGLIMGRGAPNVGDDCRHPQ